MQGEIKAYFCHFLHHVFTAAVVSLMSEVGSRYFQFLRAAAAESGVEYRLLIIKQ